MTRECATPDCTGEIPDSSRPTTIKCRNCRANIYAWLKRKPTEVLERRRKLNLYGERVDTVITQKGLRGRK